MEGHRIEQYSDALASDGIVVIEDYFDTEKCETIYEGIDSALQNGEVDYIDEEMSYTELANLEKMTVNQREGETDDGMLDIFHVDIEYGEAEEFKFDSDIQQIINRVGDEDYAPDSTNVYVNKSITNTRGYHADSFSGKFKSFLYLTDVPNDSYGPYSYVKGSHAAPGYVNFATRLVNKIRGRKVTDAVFYNPSDIITCTGTKGTLIISDQSGYHRGIPQEPGKERMLMTTHYVIS